MCRATLIFTIFSRFQLIFVNGGFLRIHGDVILWVRRFSASVEKVNLLKISFHRGCKFVSESYPQIPWKLSNHLFLWFNSNCIGNMHFKKWYVKWTIKHQFYHPNCFKYVYQYLPSFKLLEKFTSILRWCMIISSVVSVPW